MKITTQVVCGSWVTNVYNPHAPNAKSYYEYSSFASPEQKEREWQDHLKWIKSFEIGFPKETSHYSTEHLFRMHMVGLYKRKTIITIE